MQTTPSTGRGTVHIGIALQLFLSHLVAGCVALGIFFALSHVGLHATEQFLVAIGVGAVVGVLLTLNITYGLYILELTLARFAQGFAVEKIAPVWRWPLHTLFLQTNAVSERIQAFARNEHLTEEFREQMLQQAGEAAALEERNRIARDLHDSIKQQIFSISISAATAKAHWGSNVATQEGAREAVEDIQRSAKEAQVEMQALLQQLRSAPLENTSLVAALRTQAEALGYRIGAKMVVEIGELPASDRLLPGTQEAIFRMVQEAFANIARHARATTVWLSLYQRDNMLQVEVRDNGQGFDNAAKMGMGLANLRQRATDLKGTMDIASAIGQGTTMHAMLPLLDSLHTKQQEEQMQRDIRRSREQATWGFQLTENATPLAFALIVFNAPILLTIACVLAAFYGYVQAYYYRTRVALIAGRTSMEALSLQQREYNAMIFLLGLCTTLSIVAFAGQQAEAFAWHWWLLLISSCLFFGLIAFGVWWRFRGSNHYYSQLPYAELGWEIAQKKKGFGRRWRLWVIAIAAILYFGHLPTVFQSVTANAWGSYAAILGMLLFGVVILLDYVQITHWKQVLATEEMKAKQTDTSLKGVA
ncbi:MAG: sensor histidine kinase [Ktedonobacteraceae bacterium]